MKTDEYFILNKSNWPTADSQYLAGGKAANLYTLAQNNLNVPEWIVITTNSYNRFLSNIKKNISDILSSINFSDKRDISQKSDEIRNIIINNKIPDELNDTLVNSMSNFIDKNSCYAVRSSAIGEDSLLNSFAGQLETFLYIKGLDKIFESVKLCWASAFSDRVIVYKHTKDISSVSGYLDVAVIVQEMITSTISGVAFTANPLTNNYNEIVINSTFGIGEGIVSGKINTDQYIIDKKNFSIKSSRIVCKDTKIVLDNEVGYGTKEVDVEQNMRDIASLTISDIKNIAGIFLKIEKLYNYPQDIEWTIADNEFYILQTRPITTINYVEYLEDNGFLTVWDNSNITESYSGVTTPLTYSFVREAYYHVYRQFCQILNIPKRVIEELENNLMNMVGYIDGTIYYNLKNWYRLISNLPGYRYNKIFFDQMLGIKESIDFNLMGKKELSITKKYFIELPKLLITGISLLYSFMTLGFKIKKFMNNINTNYDTYIKYDFNSIGAHEIVNIIFTLRREVTMKWKPPIINDFFVMIFYGIMKRLIVKWKLDENGNLQNDLLSSQGGVDSTLPIKELIKISNFIKRDIDLKNDFLNQSVEQMIKKYLQKNNIKLNDKEQEVKIRIETYLNTYGFRSMNELKLEEVSLSEEPSYLFKMLKNYITTSIDSDMFNRTKFRTAAEQIVKKKLQFKFTLFIPKKLIFKIVLSLTRRGVRFREYQRFARSKIYTLFKKIFSALGNKFYHLGLLDQPRDIFFMTREEILSYIQGTSVNSNIKELIKLRKIEHEKFQIDDQTKETNRRIYSYGIVYRIRENDEIFNEKSHTEINITNSSDQTLLKGIGCCPGIVKGRVKVIESPQDDVSLNGEILVAGKTDPGWVTLYPAASGLLIERGSVLSHSAIVAREMGLPTIVGIDGILQVLQSGDEVEIDGSTGIVKILSRIRDR